MDNKKLEQHYACEKLNRLINALPDDVMRHIYEEYFVAKDTCENFIKLLHTDASTSLDYKPLLEPARLLLNHPCAIEYVCIKNPLFKQMYTEHYLKNNKYFVHMTTLQSFVLSILMHMYH